MSNFFKNLPFNESRQFVMEKDKSGCEIYIPIVFTTNKRITQEQYELRMKRELREVLKNQPSPHIFNFPPRTPNAA